MTLTEAKLTETIANAEFFAAHPNAPDFIGLHMIDISDTLNATGRGSALRGSPPEPEDFFTRSRKSLDSPPRDLVIS